MAVGIVSARHRLRLGWCVRETPDGPRLVPPAGGLAIPLRPQSWRCLREQDGLVQRADGGWYAPASSACAMR
jgi:hypothetical protein